MDDQIRRAEELLEERSRTRGQNGHGSAPASDASAASEAEAARLEELTNDLKRVAADFANYRKRNEAERTEFAKYAKSDLIAKLLEVLDGYDRALATVPDELKGQPWVEGMWLVERKLRQVLENEGLIPVDALGKPFDPYVHEAVGHVESDLPEGTVIEEFQKAYRLHDRVIRPALVAVAKTRAGNAEGKQGQGPLGTK
jgi:molecular chaperone GrpE